MLKETEFLNLKKKNYQANIRHEALEQKKKRKQRRIRAHYGLLCSSLCIIRESIENSPAITNANTNITYDDRLNNYGNKGIHYHQTEKAQSQCQVKPFSSQDIKISRFGNSYCFHLQIYRNHPYYFTQYIII